MKSLYAAMFGKKPPVIIPVASGKGGVGKSVFSANLAVALAESGKETCAVDLDFGGSNLHNYLGMPNKYAGIGDYLKKGDIEFKSLFVKTPVKRLKLIPGDGKTPFMANVPFEQREKLLNEIQKIDADYIVLDLAAGSSFNTLNFFGLSRKAVMITTFETPAVMNFLMFLKYFVFRIIAGMVRHDDRVLAIVKNMLKTSGDGPSLTTTKLLDIIDREDPGLAEKSLRAVKSYTPRIVFNMGEGAGDLRILNKIDRTLKNNIHIEAEYLGFIFYDHRLRQAVRSEKNLMTQYPDIPFCKDIRAVAKKILTSREKNMPKSIENIMIETKNVEAERRR